MNQFKVGDKFTIKYPFYKQQMETIDGKKNYWVTPGCHRAVCDEDVGWGSMDVVYWIANYIGEICYEILSIAKMPVRYLDRVIIKYYYILPDGNKFSNGSIKTLTTRKLNEQIKSNSVFPCEYEEDESY